MTEARPESAPGLRVLVVNAGSSSLKLRLLDPADRLAGSADLPAPARRRRLGRGARRASTGWGRSTPWGTGSCTAARQFLGPVLVSGDVVRRLEALSDLAPLHQPKSLAALAAVSAALPGVPAVACFDTAFHARMPAAAATYALPLEWRKRWDLRRFGFHGLSHSYVARRVAQLAGPPAGGLRLVSCHLGAGASLAAIDDGRSVDTTMGFTPLDGLVMATRSGSVDPGSCSGSRSTSACRPPSWPPPSSTAAACWGCRAAPTCERCSSPRSEGDPDAALAVAVYLHRLRAAVAAMAAAMGGLDALAFTGGVGENSAPIRRRAAEGLAFLGVAIDEAAAAGTGRGAAAEAARAVVAAKGAGEGDREITAPGARVRSFVVAAREDLQIAAEVRAVLDAPPS